ncbi:MAG: hypothetical protein BM564_03875 [Bacteroidetes bacterium MedPE-SWsnd-G2]|nr:MAG: hypothetical protein BM564_03875 [Bacteroidetes bacterium MedPE-SWsnd-G2]
MAQHNDLGKKGEDLAVEFMINEGYQILDRNYRFDRAEVDILCLKEGVLVALEVKTRASSHFGDPQDFVTSKQIKQLVKVVDHYVVDHDMDVEVRFDIIAILKQKENYKIKHFKDAFYHF